MSKPQPKDIKEGTRVRFKLGSGRGAQEHDGTVESFTESGKARVKTDSGFSVNVDPEILTELEPEAKKYGKD